MHRRIAANDIPGDVIDLCRALRTHGYRAWVVGGCLRDLLRGRPAADWDLATDARPEQVSSVFKRVIPTGVAHGTVTVRLRGASYEVTTLRGEGAYSDGRRPDSVEFVSDIQADLSRRDFTINAIAYDPLDDTLTDPFGGLSDLDARVVRAVGDAHTRFSEDGLRVLRAARFAATLGFALDPATEVAIRPTLDTFRKVSAERVREEWLKTLKADEPAPAFDIMARTGILDVTAPALANLPEPEFQRGLAALRAAPQDQAMRLAALFHPLTDLDWIEDWLKRYRFSNAEREEVLLLLRSFAAEGVVSDADLRRYARSVGRQNVARALSLGLIVARVSDATPRLSALTALLARAANLLGPDVALTTKELAIGGRDLMTELGLSPGRRVGEILEALLERVLDEPALNTRPALLDAARAMLAEDSA